MKVTNGKAAKCCTIQTIAENKFSDNVGRVEYLGKTKKKQISRTSRLRVEEIWEVTAKTRFRNFVVFIVSKNISIKTQIKILLVV